MKCLSDALTVGYEEEGQLLNKKVVKVMFENSIKMYDFWTDLDLKVGDRVVVDTTVGLTVGSVVGFEDNSSRAVRWVVQKVDLDSFNRRIKSYEDLENLLKKMEERRKKLEDIQIYRELAKNDPELQKLVRKYDSLVKKVQRKGKQNAETESII